MTSQDAEQLYQAQELFWRVLELEPAERARFLEQLRSDNPHLAQDVESLLAADQQAEGFLDRLPGHALAAFERLQAYELGDRIGAFAIVKRLGRGGMGNVYLAERADSGFRQQVAIKVVRPGMNTDEILGRFVQERQILADLEHPNIAKLLDGGTTRSGLPYLVMEYVDGEPIDCYCDRRRLSIDDRLRLYLIVCAAVQHAHRNLVVHRDLKPGNILITPSGVPKLLDFGIAKILAPPRDGFTAATTQTGARPMSPAYASPEQVKGGAITTSTDIYCLGLLLYGLLTGERAQTLTSLSLSEIERVVCEEQPERPSLAVRKVRSYPPRDGKLSLAKAAEARSVSPERLCRKLSGDLDNIVMTAINKEPARRYESVGELAADVQRYLAGYPVRARPETLSYRTVKFVRRHKIGVAATAVILISLMAGAVGTVWQAKAATRERDHAQAAAATAQHVAQFMTDLFRASDPTATLGDTVSVREVLERGRIRLRESLNDQPDVRASLLAVLGDVYGNLGRYDDAHTLLEEALELRRLLYGSQDLRVAATLRSLGTAYQEARRFEAARPLLQEALRIHDRLSPSQRDSREAQLEAAETLQALGEVTRELGDPDSAVSQVRRALEIKRSLFNENHPAVIETMGVLAYVLRTKGEIDSAESIYRDVLGAQRALGDSARAELPITLNNLAYLMRLKQDYAAAETLYREALTIHGSIWDEQHLGHRILLANLASVLEYQGKYVETETALRELLKLARQEQPTDGMRLARTLSNGLGRFLSQRGRCSEAEPLLREGLEFLQREAPDHVWTSQAKGVLGACLSDLGRFAEAEDFLLQSYVAQCTVDSQSQRTDIALTLERLGGLLEHLVSLYRAWGRPGDAETYGSRLEVLRRQERQGPAAAFPPSAAC